MAKNNFLAFFSNRAFAIRRRIFWSLLAIAAILLFSVAGLLWRVSYLSEREQYLLSTAYPSQQQLEALRAYVVQTNSTLQNQLIYKNSLFAAERENIWKNFVKATTDSLNRYEKSWELLEDRTEYATLLTEID
ncbi:MAG: hypothetical protein SFU27_05135, partial [Thermonemataceae bacterium]|nr:hypothetical protein [Thermonemataceae bacterium]